MASTIITTTLDQISRDCQIVEMAKTISPMQPGTELKAVVVEMCGDRLSIIDGYHRVAGMVRWCADRSIDIATVAVSVITSDDDDLLAAASEPGNEQDAALAAIYAAI